jgi:hypothetical protein
MEWRAALNAAHLAINGLGTGFSTNELVGCITVGAIETYWAAWHDEAYASYVAAKKKPRRRLTGDAGAPISANAVPGLLTARSCLKIVIRWLRPKLRAGNSPSI